MMNSVLNVQAFSPNEKVLSSLKLNVSMNSSKIINLKSYYMPITNANTTN